MFDDILKAVQIDPGGRGLAKNPDSNLFNAFPKDLELACGSLFEEAHPKVAIFTGFCIPTAHPPAAETDGPLGAVFLADILAMFGVPVTIWTDPWAKAAIEAGLRVTNEGALDGPVVRNIEASLEPTVWHKKYRFTHLISIERVGPTREGRCHTMRGRDVTDLHRPVHRLFEEFHPKHRPVTIAVGDGGNEIGMGKVPLEVIADNIPNGAAIACRTPADYLITAGVSNWGAYALAAGVVVLESQHETGLFENFEEDLEMEILQKMVAAGLVDGVTAKQTPTVDGLDWEQYIAPFREVRKILEDVDRMGDEEADDEDGIGG